MNKRGQVLVFFVILIPILILIAAYAIDMAHVYYRSIKLDNLNKMTLEYGLKNIKEIDIKDQMNELLYKNDSSIDEIEININKDEIKINLNKKVDSIFGKIIDIKFYQLSSNYVGYIKNNKIVIEKR